MKSYRFFGDEMEVLGQRLDAARMALSISTKPWAKNFWEQTIERLLFQWRQLPVLHDGDANLTVIPRWTVDYNFVETQQEGNLYGITDRFYDKVFKQNADLHASWEAHRAQRLAKAQ
jgi:hypothetical protein